MGDRTSHTITFYDLAPADVRTVLSLMDGSSGQHPQYVSADDAEEQVIYLLESYTEEEHTVGATSDFVSELIEKAPGVSFSAYEHGNYGAPGAIFLHTPALGLWHTAYAEEPVFDVEQVRAMGAMSQPEREAALGQVHADALEVIERDLSARAKQDAGVLEVAAPEPAGPGEEGWEGLTVLTVVVPVRLDLHAALTQVVHDAAREAIEEFCAEHEVPDLATVDSHYFHGTAAALSAARNPELCERVVMGGQMCTRLAGHDGPCD